MASLTLEGVKKIFGTVAAVDDVNLSIADGEFVALLGPSGCGKTTTLRMIAGLELPNEGKISIGGQDVTHLPPRARDIAMVFQDYALYPHMTVLENVGYPLKVRGVPQAKLRDRVSELVGLPSGSAGAGRAEDVHEQVLSALLNLGVGRAQAERVVDGALEELGAGAALEALIRASLKRLV